MVKGDCMSTKKTVKITMLLLVAAMVLLLAAPAEAFAADYSEITDMPQLLEDCIARMGENPSARTIWEKFPYVKEYAGEFSVTAYCGCSACNGRWTGYPAANGEALTDGLTIAVDPSVIPLGSYVLIEGVGIRKAQDTGSAVKGQDIDVYVSSHSECSSFGRRNLRVWVIPGDVVEALSRMSNADYIYAQAEA